MGNSIEKDLLTAEKVKLSAFEGLYSSKVLMFDNFALYEESEPWKQVKIKVHEMKIDCVEDEGALQYYIDMNFIVIEQNLQEKEILVGLMDRNRIWIIRAHNLRDFLDLTNVLMYSKVPYWTQSPRCQVCSKVFSLGKRKHHCRSCGKCICNKCVYGTDFRHEGVFSFKYICEKCFLLIKAQISLIQEVRLLKNRHV